MQSAVFRFYAGLNDFLDPSYAQREFRYAFWGHPAIKDAIEALGPPHPEVDLILINGQSVAFDYNLSDGDRVSVYPHFSLLDIAVLSHVQPASPQQYSFVIDTHLGRLARYLRMLGFDSLYRTDFSDDELARLSTLDGRILLTRDRGLLKRSEVKQGYCVRKDHPRHQLVEVLTRFSLVTFLLPFSRCMHCNQGLLAAARQQVRSRVPERIFQNHDQFRECPGCGRVYWRGSHHTRMERLIATVVSEVMRNFDPGFSSGTET